MFKKFINVEVTEPSLYNSRSKLDLPIAKQHEWESEHIIHLYLLDKETHTRASLTALAFVVKFNLQTYFSKLLIVAKFANFRRSFLYVSLRFSLEGFRGISTGIFIQIDFCMVLSVL
jgi:hypothetical protein